MPRFSLPEAHALLACGVLAMVCACGDDDRMMPIDAGGGADSTIPFPAPECPADTEMCDEACVDTQQSRAHCGACGVACGAGDACVDGTCQVLCPAGQTDCGGSCVDTMDDRRHCGGCGTECSVGEICVDGGCEVSCPAGHTLCGTVCVDTTSDPGHCGACDAACGTGEVCSESTCATECASALMLCGGACIDTQNNPLHCGACDAACPIPAGSTAVCAAGSCRAICDPLAGDCNADLRRATTDGCERPLATDPANCGACNLVCSLANAVAGCDAGACVIAGCDSPWADCDATASNGCEVDISADDSNCGACGVVCAATERCVTGTCTPIVGDTCGTAVSLSSGANTVSWAAFAADYLTAPPSCSSTSLAGPDLVFAYTATIDERVTVEFEKPTSQRWTAVMSTETCGTITPSVACVSEFTADTMSGSFVLMAGQTVYSYLVDTTSGTAPLDNPLTVNVTATACTATPGVTLSPPNGSTVVRSATFMATFDAPMVTTLGTVTIMGSMGTSLTYNLATSPSEVTWSGGNTVMEIQPGIRFPAGETLTISWSGMQSLPCTTLVPVPPPTWVVSTPSGCFGDMCCADLDLGSAVGTAVAMGSTSGTSLYDPCTLGGGGPEIMYTWTAPAAGTYTFDTCGSSYDTTLWVANGTSCGGASLGCNDDSTCGLQSTLTVTLTAGQAIVIGVDGYSTTSSGSYVLNISGP